MENLIFIPGEAPGPASPLGRYLPPLPAGVACTWLAAHAEPGEWILDPFGAAPQVAVEAARCGYRVLAAANNPITRFLLEINAAPPHQTELRSVLAELAAARSGEQRLEPYLKSLYQTECAGCGSHIPAQAFIWERPAGEGSSEQLTARLYTCPQCGDSGERPATDADKARAAQYAAQAGLHRARALERVAARDDPDREHAEEALAVYLPRAVLALFTLINKLDGLNLSPTRQNWLRLLLLSACDQANTLWQHPSARQRPRQLTVPPRFREHNLWLALENAVEQWAQPGLEVPLKSWENHTELPDSGGVAIFEGRLVDLASQLSATPIAAVLAPLPRPNQAFWTLSALWSGWLWGRNAVSAFKTVLRRRRYDWGWHASALRAAFAGLATHLPAETPVLGLMSEAEPGFLSAAVSAAAGSGLRLEASALRTASGQAHLAWRINPQAVPDPAAAVDEAGLVAQAAGASLRQRGEASPYLPLHLAGLAALAEAGAFANPPDEPGPLPGVTTASAAFQAALTYRGGFVRFAGSANALEVGSWWLRDELPQGKPLADQAEIAVVTGLIRSGGLTFAEADQLACQALPGALAPEPELIQAILDSYAVPDERQPRRWRLRPEDQPGARRQELTELKSLLSDLGKRLGYQVEGDLPLRWLTADGRLASGFYVLASANLGEILYRQATTPAHSWIVAPGGRAQLLLFKLRRDALLQQTVQAGWRFVKFRQLRRAAEGALLDPAGLEAQLLLDPLAADDPQIPLL